MIGLSASPSDDARLAVAALAALTAVFALKHYAADFLLQTGWMVRGKERGRDWVPPLAIHAFCHAALTGLIVAVVAPRLWWLAVLDFLVHFTVDRGKAMIAATNRWQPTQPQFWWLLGLDQLLHQLTNVGLAWAIVVL